MKSRVLAFLCTFLVAPVVVAAPLAGDPSVPSGPEQFQVKEKTEVPNTTLQPGSYSIRILDHLRDRVILQVSDKSNHVASTFLAVPASTMANAPAGPISYGSGPKGKAALKGFSFPGGVAVEFVYPKNDAVSIAKANDTRVMAIDPASEGRVPAQKLKQDDMEMITLWMLEPSRVGPGDAKAPAIAATRYKAPQPSTSASVETAQAQPAPVPPAAPVAVPAPVSSENTIATSSTPSPAPRPVMRKAPPVQMAQNDVAAPPAPVRTHVRPANVKALPHTGSSLPLLWLATGLSLLSGGLLTGRRLALQR